MSLIKVSSMSSNNSVSTILFDLGGVLIELDGPPIKAHWISTRLSHEQNWQLWMSSTFVQRYETGAISSADFVTGVIGELNLEVSEDDFKQAFIQWPKELFAGASEMLMALKSRYTLAFFSNTSALHLPRLLDELALADYFDHTYASYEIGFFKPDVHGFHYVVKDMRVEAANVLFLDDNQVNVDAARKAGLQAEKAHGLTEVKSVLSAYGCIREK